MKNRKSIANIKIYVILFCYLKEAKMAKTKQYLYVMNVATNQQNGLENVLLVVVGIHF